MSKRVNQTIWGSALSLGLLCCSSVALAHSEGPRADSHAPIGVMGDHMHKKGEFMLSFRHMSMSMSGSVQGGADISDDDIATSEPNPFAMMPNMPPTLRIVPQSMDMSMQMLGMMYAPSDKVTLMAMLNYLSKDMRLKTYQGGMGTNVLGEFETSVSGVGDTKIGALISLHDAQTHKWHANVGLSLPTGGVTERGTVLTPMNMQMDMRLPYAMQLGSGSYDFEPGLTYTGFSENLSWGSQYKMIVRLTESGEDYRLGNEQTLSAWGQFLFSPSVSTSLRLTAQQRSNISGQDENIMGPVQTADPNRYAGTRVDAGLGLNLLGQNGWLKGQRIALEYRLPLIEDVEGPQMSLDGSLNVGYQYAF